MSIGPDERMPFSVVGWDSTRAAIEMVTLSLPVLLLFEIRL
jgi:hypothetical protein